MWITFERHRKIGRVLGDSWTVQTKKLRCTWLQTFWKLLISFFVPCSLPFFLNRRALYPWIKRTVTGKTMVMFVWKVQTKKLRCANHFWKLLILLFIPYLFFQTTRPCMKWTATGKTMETEMNSMSPRKHSKISMKQRWALW